MSLEVGGIGHFKSIEDLMDLLGPGVEGVYSSGVDISCSMLFHYILYTISVAYPRWYRISSTNSMSAGWRVSWVLHDFAIFC